MSETQSSLSILKVFQIICFGNALLNLVGGVLAFLGVGDWVDIGAEKEIDVYVLAPWLAVIFAWVIFGVGAWCFENSKYLVAVNLEYVSLELLMLGICLVHFIFLLDVAAGDRSVIGDFGSHTANMILIFVALSAVVAGSSFIGLWAEKIWGWSLAWVALVAFITLLVVLGSHVESRIPRTFATGIFVCVAGIATSILCAYKLREKIVNIPYRTSRALSFLSLLVMCSGLILLVVSEWTGFGISICAAFILVMYIQRRSWMVVSMLQPWISLVARVNRARQ